MHVEILGAYDGVLRSGNIGVLHLCALWRAIRPRPRRLTQRAVRRRSQAREPSVGTGLQQHVGHQKQRTAKATVQAQGFTKQRVGQAHLETS